jgi:hypothetical protein
MWVFRPFCKGEHSCQFLIFSITGDFFWESCLLFHSFFLIFSLTNLENCSISAHGNPPHYFQNVGYFCKPMNSIHLSSHLMMDIFVISICCYQEYRNEYCFLVLGLKPRASHMLVKHSTTELHSQLRNILFNISFCLCLYIFISSVFNGCDKGYFLNFLTSD